MESSGVEDVMNNSDLLNISRDRSCAYIIVILYYLLANGRNRRFHEIKHIHYERILQQTVYLWEMGIIHVQIGTIPAKAYVHSV